MPMTEAKKTKRAVMRNGPTSQLRSVDPACGQIRLGGERASRSSLVHWLIVLVSCLRALACIVPHRFNRTRIDSFLTPTPRIRWNSRRSRWPM